MGSRCGRLRLFSSERRGAFRGPLLVLGFQFGFVLRGVLAGSLPLTAALASSVSFLARFVRRDFALLRIVSREPPAAVACICRVTLAGRAGADHLWSGRFLCGSLNAHGLWTVLGTAAPKAESEKAHHHGQHAHTDQNTLVLGLHSMITTWTMIRSAITLITGYPAW